LITPDSHIIALLILLPHYIFIDYAAFIAIITTLITLFITCHYATLFSRIIDTLSLPLPLILIAMPIDHYWLLILIHSRHCLRHYFAIIIIDAIIIDISLFIIDIISIIVDASWLLLNIIIIIEILFAILLLILRHYILAIISYYAWYAIDDAFRCHYWHIDYAFVIIIDISIFSHIIIMMILILLITPLTLLIIILLITPLMIIERHDIIFIDSAITMMPLLIRLLIYIIDYFRHWYYHWYYARFSMLTLLMPLILSFHYFHYACWYYYWLLIIAIITPLFHW